MIMEKQLASSRPALILKTQELNILEYLSDKSEVAWEELAQFAKDPQTVKKETLQKVVSDLKRKYKDRGLSIPFNCNFISLIKTEPAKAKSVSPQSLVSVRTTKGGRMVSSSDMRPDAHIDFVLDRLYKRVITRNGKVNLSDNEWEMFNILYQNVGRKVSLSDMKDIVYKNFGSKTPYNWADCLRRTLTKLRTNLPELKNNNRLITMIGGSTTYYMLE